MIDPLNALTNPPRKIKSDRLQIFSLNSYCPEGGRRYNIHRSYRTYSDSLIYRRRFCLLLKKPP